MNTSSAAIFCASMLAAATCHANIVVNGSFEQGSFAPPSNATMTLSPGNGALTAWEVVNDAVAWIGVGDPWSLDAYGGDRFLDLSDYSAGAPFGGVRQVLATTPGVTYTVAFQLGSSNRWGRPSAMSVSAGGVTETFTSPLTGTLNDWTPHTMSFTATSSASMLSFVGNSGVNYIGLDDVVVTASAVPEPGALALVLAGGIMVTGAVGRRRAR